MRSEKEKRPASAGLLIVSDSIVLAFDSILPAFDSEHAEFNSIDVEMAPENVGFRFFVFLSSVSFLFKAIAAIMEGTRYIPICGRLPTRQMLFARSLASSSCQPDSSPFLQ